MAEKLWEPSEACVRSSQLTHFLARLAERGFEFPDYASLHAWSIQERARFWSEVWDFAAVIAQQPAISVLENPDAMPGARWFRGARLNFAENLLRGSEGQDSDAGGSDARDSGARVALICCDEAGRERTLTRAELRREVARAAVALRSLGVGVGDRVAGILPNAAEAVIAMLAASSLGAVWTSSSPDFGTSAILDRFRQTRPRVLIGVDGYEYGGRRFDRRASLAEVATELDCAEHVVVVRRLDPEVDLSSIPRAVAWESFLRAGDASADRPLEFAPLPFDHPLYILYSSGTTGPPKCIVHGAGGTLLQHLKELLLHTDLRRDDRIFYFTTCGWMMWNWLVSALAVGAALVLFDGSPFHPSPDRLFELAERTELSHFGTSAKFLAAAQAQGLRPIEQHPLRSLRTVLSTGSPLSPEGFRYVYADIKRDVRVSSISGGTDIVSCFFAGNPNAPVYAGELQCIGLGMAVAAFDSEGRPRIGEKGELVCTRPFPSMPIGFFDDPGGERYRRAYFERFPGVWHHGDFVEITPRGTAIVYGRSDATLNPGGVRIGTAEIYRQVEGFEDVIDSLVVGQDMGDDVRVLLFVQLAEGLALDEDRRSRIRARIRSHTSPRHVPAKIIQVDAVPYTRSGKKVELAVRDLIHGRPPAQTEAIANPECLDQYVERLARA